MSRSRASGWLLIAATLSSVSCKRLWTTQDAAATSEPAVAGQQVVTSASTAQREQAVVALLRGAASASALPASYEEPGLAFDERLRAKLSMVVEGATSEVQVRLEPVTTSNGLPKEVVQRVLRGHLGGLRACVGGRDKPSVTGTIVLSFVINAEGAVRDTSQVSATFDDEAMAACLMGRLSNIVFPAPTAGAVKVSVPVQIIAPTSSP